MKKAANWDKCVTEFISEYVNVPKKSFTPSGVLTLSALKAAIAMLMSERVFTSRQDMRKQAMRDYGIILPEEIFE